MDGSAGVGVNLDVKLFGVKSRMPHIERLVDKLGLGKGDVFIDDRGPRGANDAWGNAKRAWLSELGDATHRLVVQDDIVVCDGFMEILKGEILPRFHGAALTFSCGARVKPHHRKGDSPYVRLKGCVTSGQAIVLPAVHIGKMVEWSDYVFGSEYPHDDGRIGWYCAYYGVPMFTVIPSLVDHLQIDSVIKHHSRKDRNCRTWVGEDVGFQDWANMDYSLSPLWMPTMWMNEKNPNYPKVVKMMDRARSKAREIKKGDDLREWGVADA